MTGLVKIECEETWGTWSDYRWLGPCEINGTPYRVERTEASPEGKLLLWAKVGR